MGLGDKKWTNLKEENRLKILKSGKLIRGTGADGVSFSKAIFDHICSEKDAWRLSIAVLTKKTLPKKFKPLDPF